MIIVAGTVRIDPSKREATREAMDKVIKASRAEAGCIEYSYAIDVLDPHVVHVFEVWRDKEALQLHFKMPHLSDWRESWTLIGVSDRKLQMYEIGGVSPL